MLSVDPHGVPELVGRPLRTSKSGRETLPEFRKWSEDLPGGPEVVGRLSRRSENGREILPGDPEVVRRPSQRSGSGRETLPKVRKCSGDPHVSAEVVGDLT